MNWACTLVDEAGEVTRNHHWTCALYHDCVIKALGRDRMFSGQARFRQIPSCPGVWANERTLEKCRDVLREVLEEWIILKLRNGDQLPSIGGIDLNRGTAGT